MNHDSPHRLPGRLPELMKQIDRAQDDQALPTFDLDAVVRGGRRRQRRRRAAATTALLAGAAATAGVLLLSAGGTREESLVPAHPPTAPGYTSSAGPAPSAPTPGLPAGTAPAPSPARTDPASVPAKASSRAVAPISRPPSATRPGPSVSPSPTTPAATRSTQPPEGGPPSAAPDCAAAAALTYVQAVTATATGASVVVAAHPATLVCGGVDDRNYRVAGTAQTLHLTSTATVTVLDVGTDVTARQISPADLPGWLVVDPNEKVFQVIGPPDAVTSLVEQYHP